MARLDLDLQPLRAQLAASAWVRRRLAPAIERADVVHVYTHNCALLSSGVLAEVPTVVSLDSTTALNSTRLPYREPTRYTHLTVRASAWFERRVFGAADRVIANSNWAAESLRGDYGLDESKLLVFPFGIVAPAFDGPAPGISDDRPALVFVGRQLERKGGNRLLRLYREHLADRARLVLVTEDAVDPTPGVTVIGDLRPGDDRLWDVLRSGAVFVFPSPIDQAPNAVIEAMAAGLPVVALECAALPEMVLDGRSGFLIPPDAPDTELLAAIERLVGDPTTMATFGEAARRRFKQHYDAHESTARLVSVLREVAR